MRTLATIARSVAAGAPVTYTWIPRSRNSDADALANEAMDTESLAIRRGHDADGRDEEDDLGLF
jgi:ribonuclease HI